jgi:hypothetical protein
MAFSRHLANKYEGVRLCVPAEVDTCLCVLNLWLQWHMRLFSVVCIAHDYISVATSHFHGPMGKLYYYKQTREA